VNWWKRRAEQLQPHSDSHFASQNKLIPVEYLQWLGLAEYVSIHGLARCGNSAGFTPHPGASGLVAAEQRAIKEYFKRRTPKLMEKLDKLVDEAPDEHGWTPEEYETPSESARARQARIDPDLPPEAEAA
jgi:hypothetical protein